MIEYNYPECTTACLTVLSIFSRHYPDYRTSDVRSVILPDLRYMMRAVFDHASLLTDVQ